MAFRLIKDLLTTSLGLGTKKERIDVKLEQFHKQEVNELNYSIAKRNVVIQSLKSKIHYFENIFKMNKRIVDLCNAILDQAKEEITKADSQIYFNIYNEDNSILATGNVAVLKETLRLKKIQNPAFYIKQIENSIDTMVYKLIEKVICNKGYIIINNVRIDLRDIYNNYLKLEQLMNLGTIVDIQNKIININKSGLNLILDLREICLKNVHSTDLVLHKLRLSEEMLNNQSLQEKYLLEEIENAKRLIVATEEYMEAKASDDYLEKTGRK